MPLIAKTDFRALVGLKPVSLKKGEKFTGTKTEEARLVRMGLVEEARKRGKAEIDD